MTPELPAATPAEAVVLVLCHFPDHASAAQCARTLVTRRLAACVSVGAPVQSVYIWQEHLEETHEVPLCAKTTAAGYAAVATALRTAHPYELPDILAVPVSQGLPDYLAWVAAAVATPAP